MHVPQHTNKLIFTFLYWQTPLSPASPPLPTLIVNNIFPLVHTRTHTSARIKYMNSHKPTTTKTLPFLLCRNPLPQCHNCIRRRLSWWWWWWRWWCLLTTSTGTTRWLVWYCLLTTKPTHIIILFLFMIVPLFRMTVWLFVCLFIFRPSPPPKIIIGPWGIYLGLLLLPSPPSQRRLLLLRIQQYNERHGFVVVRGTIVVHLSQFSSQGSFGDNHDLLLGRCPWRRRLREGCPYAIRSVDNYIIKGVQQNDEIYMMRSAGSLYS